jgi:hypothetical protein
VGAAFACRVIEKGLIISASKNNVVTARPRSEIERILPPIYLGLKKIHPTQPDNLGWILHMFFKKSDPNL